MPASSFAGAPIMKSLLRIAPSTLALTLLVAVSAGCGGEAVYVRGNQVPGLDDAAMSTGIDRHDIEQLLHDNLKSMMSAPVAHQWNRDRTRPTLAIYPIANETSEHI